MIAEDKPPLIPPVRPVAAGVHRRRERTREIVSTVTTQRNLSVASVLYSIIKYAMRSYNQSSGYMAYKALPIGPTCHKLAIT